jgi:hypothetical protein
MVVRDRGVGVVDLAWGIGGPERREAAMECFAEGVLGVAQGLQDICHNKFESGFLPIVVL